MTNELRIRKAEASDVATILELIQALAKFEKLEHECIATEEKLLATLFSAFPAAEVILAELKDGAQWKNAGFALFFSSYSTFLALPGLYLEDLFVRPGFRSQGIGRELLKYLARLTVERGYGRLEWSVLDWNTRARDFYASLGAQPMSEWTVHRLTGAALLDLAQG